MDKKPSPAGGPEREPQPDAAIRAREQAAYRYLLGQSSTPYASELTLGLLHRFNNLITGIMFMTDDCLARAAADGPMQERLGEIAGTLRAAHAVVDRVVDLHVGDEGDQASYYELDALIADQLDLLALLLPKGTPIRHSAAAEPVCFYGSKHALCEILVHLFGNAGEILPPRGGMTWVSVETRGVPPTATLVMRNNGPGLAPEVLPHIFEPLFTTRADTGHAGLGLFRARRLAQASGGDLVARNHPEGGVEFTLTLPQSDPQSDS